MTDLAGRKPILSLDFDGVCHMYTSGWKGAHVIPDPPVPGLFEFITEASRDFEVNIFSSRSHQFGGLDAMRDWFITHFVEWHNRTTDGEAIDTAQATPIVTSLLRFPLEKPPAQIGIDDRVLTFEGQWPAIEYLRTFQPWNKRGV